MKRLSERSVDRARSRVAHAPAAAPLPELLFRAMAPSEPLLWLAREQDALYRGVISVDVRASHVTVERRAHDGGMRYSVLVRSTVRGSEKCGCSEHHDASSAVRAAYTSLLRHTVNEIACPCREAA